MSITGQVGHSAFAKQTGQGVPKTADSDFRAIKMTGDSLVSNNNPLIAEGEIGQGRDVSQMVPGGYAAAGAINGNIRARALDILLEGSLGTKTASVVPANGNSTAYNSYTVNDDLPWYSLEKRVGANATNNEQMALEYTDVMINTLNVSIPAGGLATFSAGVIACGEKQQATPIHTPTYSAASDDLLVFHGGRIMNGATGSTMARDETFQSVEIAINNNVAADEYTIRPSRFLRSLTEGIRAVDVNMTLVFENSANYAKYTYGNAAAGTPGYSFYSGALQVFLGNYQIETAGTTATPATPIDITGRTLGGQIFQSATPSGVTNAQAVQFNIPKLAFTGLPVALASGRIVVSTSARALKTASASEDIISAFMRPAGTL